ncbi:hypothetical protein SNE40_002984 [Patella caerulea]|uniref:Uncharacterized protein n=1 Tax=Patella caerulea TaxID=87958 RepID=A0AAN8K9V4_PATCE
MSGSKADLNISQVGSSIDDIGENDSISQVNRGRQTGTSKSVARVKSTASSQFSLTSSSSSLVKARLKTAELEAKNDILQKRQALLKQKLEKEMQEEQLKLEEEMAIATADVNILENQAQSTFSRKPPSIASVKSEPKSNRVPELLPFHSSSHNSGNSSEDIMLKIVREMKKTTTEMKKFGGNVLEYKQFKRKFKTKIMANTDDTDEMMDSLEYFKTGKPNNIVSGYAHVDAKEGFLAAMEELERMYGDSQVIAQAYVRKATNWPIIKTDDSKGLEDFAIFLVECKYGIKGMQTLDVMENSGILQKLLSKLPHNIKEKWRTKYKECKDKKVPAKFDHLVEIVQIESMYLSW